MVFTIYQKNRQKCFHQKLTTFLSISYGEVWAVDKHMGPSCLLIPQNSTKFDSFFPNIFSHNTMPFPFLFLQLFSLSIWESYSIPNLSSSLIQPIPRDSSLQFLLNYSNSLMVLTFWKFENNCNDNYISGNIKLRLIRWAKNECGINWFLDHICIYLIYSWSSMHTFEWVKCLWL